MPLYMATGTTVESGSYTAWTTQHREIFEASGDEVAGELARKEYGYLSELEVWRVKKKKKVATRDSADQPKAQLPSLEELAQARREQLLKFPGTKGE